MAGLVEYSRGGALTAAASSNGTIKHRINQVKTLILRHMMQVASSYIRNKALASGWTRNQLDVAFPSLYSQQKMDPKYGQIYIALMGCQ